MFYRSSFSFLFVISTLIVGLTITEAQTADELKSSLDSLNKKIDDLDKEIKEYNKKINQTQGEAKTLKSALLSLELRRNSLAKEIERIKLKVIQTEKSIGETKVKINTTENILGRNKDALAETMRLIVYQNSTLPPFVASLKEGAFLSDVFNNIKESTDVSNSLEKKVRDLNETKKVLNTEKDIFESSKKILEKLNGDLIDQKSLVEQTTKEKSSLLLQTKNKETEYQKLLSDRKKKKGDLESEMLDVESKLKVIVDASKLPKYGTGVLKYPVSNVNITQYFGNTPFSSKNPQVYNGAGHNGVDFGVKIGTPILSSLDGVVVGTGDTDTACSGVSYGKWILIKHGNGLTTLYAHLSVIQVSNGQSVITGQKIGLSGNTGYSTGPHLHFTVFASDSVHVSGPNEYKSKVCGTYMILPLAPRAGYLNPLSYL